MGKIKPMFGKAAKKSLREARQDRNANIRIRGIVFARKERMNNKKIILAPTDLSDLSRIGVRYALEMAISQSQEIVVYYVVGHEEVAPHYGVLHDQLSSLEEFPPLAEFVEKSRRDLAKFLRDSFADCISKVKIHQAVELGLPYKKIVEKAAEVRADMIVMSTHGRTGIRHMLIGSITEKVVRLASCPVLSIHSTGEAKPPK
jgi:universal stress protein A